MSSVWNKLNLKDQAAIYVCRAPDSFQPMIEEAAATVRVHTSLPKKGSVSFALLFAIRQDEVDQYAERIAALSTGDDIIWVAYPKGSSKRYKCEFNRDNGWAKFGEAGFEPVRMVAIDEDWSALRFRRVQHIKKMTRSFAITAEGKQRAAK